MQDLSDATGTPVEALKRSGHLHSLMAVKDVLHGDFVVKPDDGKKVTVREILRRKDQYDGRL